MYLYMRAYMRVWCVGVYVHVCPVYVHAKVCLHVYECVYMHPSMCVVCECTCVCTHVVTLYALHVHVPYSLKFLWE